MTGRQLVALGWRFVAALVGLFGVSIAVDALNAPGPAWAWQIVMQLAALAAVAVIWLTMPVGGDQ